MRILMLGQRGIPATHGGVEKAVQEIAVRLAGRGHDVTVLCRSAYTAPMTSYEGVRIVRLPTIPQKNLDMIVHTFIGAVWSWFHGFDVVHLHGVDPAIVSPLVSWRHRLVVTSHGRAYLRDGWGALPRAVSKFAERVFLAWPQVRTAVSRTLCDYYRTVGGRDVRYIPNGVTVRPAQDGGLVRALGLELSQYVLCVGRVDPAKGVHLLVEAFLREDRGQLKLAIVGDASGKSDYVRELRLQECERVVFLGHREGDTLKALYDHCRLFVLPSYTEGLPIVLLEALASHCDLVYSDLLPNVEVAQGFGRAFCSGDVDDLADTLNRALGQPQGSEQSADQVASRLAEYDWDRVVDSYLDSYQEAIDRRCGTSAEPDEAPSEESPPGGAEKSRWVAIDRTSHAVG